MMKRSTKNFIIIVAVLMTAAVVCGLALYGSLKTSEQMTPVPSETTLTVTTDPAIAESQLYKPSEEIENAIRNEDYTKAVQLLEADLPNYAPDDSRNENIHQLIYTLKQQQALKERVNENSLDDANLPGTG